MVFRKGIVIVGAVCAAGVALLSLRSAPAQTAAGPYRGTPEDFMEVSQLFARYNNDIDNDDGIAWANDCTADGVFADPSHCAVGREQLIAVVGRHPSPGKDQQSHHVHSLGPIVYLDHDHAKVHSTVMVVRETGFGKAGGIAVTGTYDDELLRTRGAWLFSYRLVHRPSDKPPVTCPARK